MTDRIARLRALWASRDRGSTVIEYGLMAALVVAVVIGGVTLFGSNRS